MTHGRKLENGFTIATNFTSSLDIEKSYRQNSIP